jgi:cytochrome c oxidase subunit 4
MAEHETKLQEELAARMPDPHGEVAHSEHPSTKAYIRIGIVLAVLTGIEVVVSYSHHSARLITAALLCLMFLKFILVVLWFMHLKFDSRRYSRFFVMGLAGSITLYVIVLMTFGVFGGK